MSKNNIHYPPKYWNDFDHIGEAIHAFIATHGTPGVMPNRTTLKKAGRGDIASAVDKHGTFAEVAARLGLTYTAKEKKPLGYWKDVTHVVQELQDFARTHGTPGNMPTQDELLAAKLGSLVQAIHKHGHFEEVAQRAGLVFAPIQRPKGYWTDETLYEEIMAFNRERGISNVMPKQKELELAGKGDLASAISAHGNTRLLAEKFGLALSYIKRSNKYWEVEEHVDQAVLQFIEMHGTPGVMPTNALLRQHGENGLADAISRKHGGYPAVAQRIGVANPSTAKPPKYWNDVRNVEQEIHTYNQGRGVIGVMPTYTELQDAGLSGLCAGVSKHGTFEDVARQFGLSYPTPAKPEGYWLDFGNVERELRAYAQQFGSEGSIPAHKKLQKNGYSSLSNAITHHGGIRKVAKRMEWTTTYQAKSKGYWTFEVLSEELLAFIRERGEGNRMPSKDELVLAGRADLERGISKHGGFPGVAERLGLERFDKKPFHYWDDPDTLDAALLAFIDAHGTAGVMPSQGELHRAGRYDLSSAIQSKHGGLLAVAHRLHLTTTTIERVSARTANDVQRIVRSLQPLAESSLLSGAQVLVILRRVGLLNYRNHRIKRVNASLVSGKHEDIEQALVLLKQLPDGILEDDEVDEAETVLEARIGDVPLTEGEMEESPPLESTSLLLTLLVNLPCCVDYPP